jgi:hypothetical protein
VLQADGHRVEMHHQDGRRGIWPACRFRNPTRCLRAGE